MSQLAGCATATRFAFPIIIRHLPATHRRCCKSASPRDCFYHRGTDRLAPSAVGLCVAFLSVSIFFRCLRLNLLSHCTGGGTALLTAQFYCIVSYRRQLNFGFYTPIVRLSPRTRTEQPRTHTDVRSVRTAWLDHGVGLWRHFMIGLLRVFIVTLVFSSITCHKISRSLGLRLVSFPLEVPPCCRSVMNGSCRCALRFRDSRAPKTTKRETIRNCSLRPGIVLWRFFSCVLYLFPNGYTEKHRVYI